MSRIHGRHGAVYVAATESGAAEPLQFAASWKLDVSTSKEDATAFGDQNLTYVAGLPDASGSWDGWVDTATLGTLAAALDGAPRRTYLYVDRRSPQTYFYGTFFHDVSFDVAVDGVAKASGAFSASGPLGSVAGG